MRVQERRAKALVRDGGRLQRGLEVRLDPGDGRVEKVSGTWTEDVPFVLAADTDAVRRHAIALELL